MYDSSKFDTASAPLIEAENDTKSLMLDVILALMPALAVAVFNFGFRSLTLTAAAVLAAVLAELVFCAVRKAPRSIGDFSAAVTGILVAFLMPVSVPIWLPMVGSAVTIILFKCLLGGLGKNILNPALAAYALLSAAWPSLMTNWVQPHQRLPLFTSVDTTGITATIPTAALAEGKLPAESMLDLFFGQHGGLIGETCALALLAGGAYLLIRRVISVHIPAAFLLTVAALSFVFPLGDAGRLDWMLTQLLSGSLLLGAIFIATDFSTSPASSRGKILFGIGCGVLTMLLRYFTSLPDGVAYAILIMNLVFWLFVRQGLLRRMGLDAPVQAEALENAEDAAPSTCDALSDCQESITEESTEIAESDNEADEGVKTEPTERSEAEPIQPDTDETDADKEQTQP